MKRVLSAFIMLFLSSLASAQSMSAFEDFIRCDGPCLAIDTQENSFQLFDEQFNAKIGETTLIDVIVTHALRSGTTKTDERFISKCKVASSYQLAQLSPQSAQVLSFYRERKNVLVARTYVCDVSRSSTLTAWISECSKQAINQVCGPFGYGSQDRGLISIGWGTNAGLWYLAFLR